MEHRTILKGDYVFTPLKNAFNDKISYWVSKKNHTLAVYAFTPNNQKELEGMTTDRVLDSYIKFFDSMLQRLITADESQREENFTEEWDDGGNIGCDDCPETECTGHCMSCAYRPV